MTQLLRDQKGAALLEVLIAGFLFGVALTGLALMYSSAQVWVVAQGDDRVALYIARQKVEQLRGLRVAKGLECVPTGGPGSEGEVFDADGTGSCPPVIYNETDVTAGVSGSQTFTRTTTVNCLDENYVSVSPCPAEPVAKQVAVTVISQMQQASPVTLQTVLTLH